MGAKVFLGLPFYKTVDGECLDSYDYPLKPGSENQFVKSYCGDAFLARCFNTLWCMALNQRHRRLSHFAMIHSDVRPDHGWLDVMLEEMALHGADLLSVVLPIKDARGLTSTAIRHKESKRIRRLTMTEAMGLEHKTFDAETAGFPSWELLASTGLWIARFDKPWSEEVYFNVQDRIIKRPDGEFIRETVPEDWFFSSLFHKRGLKVMATTAVPCGHWGKCEFRNDMPWGSWKHDECTGALTWLDDNSQDWE